MPNVAEKLIRSHLVSGRAVPGEEIGLAIDQTLTQDATGTMVMLELEAMGLKRVATELSAQYVDHNLLQEDNKNPDDHLFLLSACQRFGVWYSGPGNGVSHPVHMQRFGKPGKTLLGSDSHTPAAGAIGMLAIGAGGLEVALAMAGEPFFVKCPQIWGVELTGQLPDWVSAKDVILELLRRHGVRGGVGRIIEYYGPGVRTLDAWDRHVIANMGTELGATTSVFPSDERVREFLTSERRPEDFVELAADEPARFDHHDRIDLAALEPLIAKPSSPGNVVPVREVAGEPIYQAYLGSSANPGYRDLAVPALMVKERHVAPGVSFDVNPSTRALLLDLMRDGRMTELVDAGARLHQAGCNGCIGMGQAPATDRNSLRTVPRNFPGRSGVREDRVWLCSPETATASALRGAITDPRDLGMTYPRLSTHARTTDGDGMLPPLAPEQAVKHSLVKGPNIVSLPPSLPLPERLELPVLLALGDDISTDEIMPAGAQVLPYRSNVPKIADYCFAGVDASYPTRAGEQDPNLGHAIVAGYNYGQGSSREHAALAPHYLGLRLVVAKSFARIHWQNLTNFGILPLTFDDPDDAGKVRVGSRIAIADLWRALRSGNTVAAQLDGKPLRLAHTLSARQLELLESGGVINWITKRQRS